MTAPQEQKGLGALEAYIAWRSIKHSEDQDAIAAWLALQLYPLWAIQSFTELDKTTPLWVEAVLPLVETAYLQSQRVAAVFSEDVRFASLALEDPLPMDVPDVQQPEDVPAARFDAVHVPRPRVRRDRNGAVVPTLDDADTEPVTFDPFPRSDVAVSLIVNGNYRIKAKMPAPEDEAMYSGLSNSSGAAIRQAMNGGRNATGRVLKFDRRIIGYARVTDGNPCWYCALLASRGAVYAKDSFIRGGRTRFDGTLTKADKDFEPPKDGPELPEGYSNAAKVHDHCRCQLRPVYANETSFARTRFEPKRDEEAQFYFDQWEQVSQDWYWLSNREKLLKFRDQYRPFQRKPADVTDIREELENRIDALSDPLSPQSEWANAQLSQLAS
ncbi:capsid maturation protease [Mycobacterium phage Reindeer]|uniref:Capsid maturation protease n=1 Tax=Mycobacterium phage Reindeer TaxID=2762283 RepID=A0A7G8LHV2_9CAUD|nr:head maturation protease [Mycobacterium phage Reindeer]QNJ56824.1 capsid maturation protease [Mycobacterium phage Reindeer]